MKITGLKKEMKFQINLTKYIIVSVLLISANPSAQ